MGLTLTPRRGRRIAANIAKLRLQHALPSRTDTRQPQDGTHCIGTAAGSHPDCRPFSSRLLRCRLLKNDD
jgi:hypothetical protein